MAQQQDTQGKSTETRLTTVEVSQSAARDRMNRFEIRMDRLEAKVDRLLFALLGAAVVILGAMAAGFIAVLAALAAN